MRARATPHTASACSSLPRMPASTGTAPASASAAPKPWSTRPTMQHLERVGEARTRATATANTAEADAGEHVTAHPPLEREHRERADDDREVVRGDRPRDADDRHVERAVEVGEGEHDDRRVGDRERDRERDDGDEEGISTEPRRHGRGFDIRLLPRSARVGCEGHRRAERCPPGRAPERQQRAGPITTIARTVVIARPVSHPRSTLPACTGGTGAGSRAPAHRRRTRVCESPVRRTARTTG